MGRCGLKGAAITLAFVGALFLVVGLIDIPVIDQLIGEQVRQQIRLSSNETEFFDLWRAPDKYVNEYQQFYMYNVTNPDEFAKGSKPIIQALGPFTYQQNSTKFDVRWTDNNTIIRFKYDRYFHLLNETCNSTVDNGLNFSGVACTFPDDLNITTINSPFVTMVRIVDLIPFLSIEMREDVIGVVRAIADAIFHDEGLFIQRPAHDILFGYNDTILADFIDKVIDGINDLNTSTWNFTIPTIPTLDPKIVLQANHSDPTWQQDSAVYTGMDTTDHVFEYVAWAGHNRTLGIYTGCGDTEQGQSWRLEGNMINGTDGRQFPPLMSDDQPIAVFSEDIFRSAQLARDGNETYKGVYIIAKYQMQNETEYKPNCAFGMNTPYGVMNMTDAFQGAPAFASKPNFYQADPSYRALVDGLEEGSPADETVLKVEPTTGATFSGSQQLMISVHVQNKPHLPLMNKLPSETFLPVFRANLFGGVTEELLEQYKGQIGVARTAEGLIHVWGIPVGLALLAASICLGFAWFGRTRRGQQLMTKATVSVGASDLLRSRNYDGSMEDVYLGSASMNANVGETSPLLDGTH